jgi:hypothetical protein
MNKFSYIIFAAVLISSCKLDDQLDPNNPSVSSVTNNATVNQLQNLVIGLEARSKSYIGTASNAYGVFGREIWYFNRTDARYNQFWLGQGGRKPNSTFFGVDAAFTSAYQTIRQGNLLISALANTNSVTAEQKHAYSGFTKTIQGYQYIIPANSQYENGIRIDVKDEQHPGPFVKYQPALTAIRSLLDSGYLELKQAGTTLPFSLSAGYTGFNTPEGLGKVNRALAARVAIYQKDWQGALDALALSFFTLDGNLLAGPAHTFSAPPDTYNPLFYVLNASPATITVVHPSLIEDAIPGDLRLNKFFKRTTVLTNTQGDVPLSSQYQDNRWATNSAPITYIKNEELILIYAEASAQLQQFDNAVKAIDRIRTAAGLPVYTGERSTAALITEILFQRRYSLWYEPAGHRWVDLRRYGRLNEIPVAADKGSVFTQMETPINELNWDLYSN